MSGKILVLGSSNVDLILRISRFHKPGETILGEDLITVHGGKGANQALAAKRLGGEVILLTKLGNDHHGRIYHEYLAGTGLPPQYLLKDKKLPSGVALIEVNPEGENRIIVSPGANRSLSEKDINRFGRLWQGVNTFVTQLEIPLPTVIAGLKRAKHHGAITLLNPSPPIPLSSEILSYVDFLVPNEIETRCLTGMRGEGRKRIHHMAGKLLQKGAKNVVVTLGPQGLLFLNQVEEIWMKAFKVNAIDTTAAGDAFMGTLAWGLSEGRPIREVLKFANGAGALAATKLGAQPSLPYRKDLDRFLSRLTSPSDSTMLRSISLPKGAAHE
jgi:ribokinase